MHILFFLIQPFSLCLDTVHLLFQQLTGMWILTGHIAQIMFHLLADPLVLLHLFCIVLLITDSQSILMMQIQCTLLQIVFITASCHGDPCCLLCL